MRIDKAEFQKTHMNELNIWWIEYVSNITTFPDKILYVPY